MSSPFENPGLCLTRDLVYHSVQWSPDRSMRQEARSAGGSLNSDRSENQKKQQLAEERRIWEKQVLTFMHIELLF